MHSRSRLFDRIPPQATAQGEIDGLRARYNPAPCGNRNIRWYNSPCVRGGRLLLGWVQISGSEEDALPPKCHFSENVPYPFHTMVCATPQSAEGENHLHRDAAREQKTGIGSPRKFLILSVNLRRIDCSQLQGHARDKPSPPLSRDFHLGSRLASWRLAHNITREAAKGYLVSGLSSASLGLQGRIYTWS